MSHGSGTIIETPADRERHVEDVIDRGRMGRLEPAGGLRWGRRGRLEVSGLQRRGPLLQLKKRSQRLLERLGIDPRRGEEASGLWPSAIDLLARWAEQEHDPARLEAAVGMAERGASRAFLQAFGRAHARLAGCVAPEAPGDLARSESRLSVLDQKNDKAQLVPVEKRDPKVVRPLLDERREAEAERGKVSARIEREFPQYAALKYPRPCALDQARATLGEAARVPTQRP